MELKKNLKLLISSALLLIVFACSTHNTIMYNQINISCNKSQVDSVCKQEGLPYINQCGWAKSQFVDLKSGSDLTHYIYKIDQDSVKYTYTVSKLGDDYRFKKTVNKKVKK